jgi:hypothetical protein
VSNLMALDELRVAIYRKDLSLEEFHRAINGLAESRDHDVPAVLSPNPIRFDINHARFYWQAKYSPLTAYNDHRTRLRQRIIYYRKLREKIKAKASLIYRVTLTLMFGGGIALAIAWGGARCTVTSKARQAPKISPEWEACFKEQYGARLSASTGRAVQYSRAAAAALDTSTQSMELSDQYSDAAKAEDRYMEKYAPMEAAETCDQTIGRH